MPTHWINGKKLQDIRTWGKHLLFIFSNGTVRVHLGLFGDVLVDERKKVNRSFFLEFAKGEINGYVVRAEKLKAPPDEVYDWRTDILSKDFDAAYVKSLLKEQSKKTIEGYATNIIEDLSESWLDKRDTTKPFCLVIGHKATHRTWMPDTRDMGMFDKVNFPLPHDFYDNYDSL